MAFDNRAVAVPALDSSQVMADAGEVVYSWDVETDRLRWGGNAGLIFDALKATIAESGIAYARHIDGMSATSRYDAVFGGRDRDVGDGVPFATTYALTRPDRGPHTAIALWVEDRGRWFAGADGRAHRVQGTVRLRPAPGAEANRNTRRGHAQNIGRDALLAALAEAMPATQRATAGPALLLLAIEDLGLIRQTYGYAVVEEMIQATVDRLRTRVRRDDAVARWPENGCAVVLRGCGAAEAAQVGQRLLALLANHAVVTSAGRFDAPVRIAAAAADATLRDPAVLLRHAEDALGTAMQAGDRRLVTYAPDPSRDATQTETREATDTILQSLDASRVFLMFQPIVSARTRTVFCYEALTRMTGLDGTVVSPASIFPVAERSGLVRRIDRRALELAVAHLVSRPERTVSVNVSALSAHDPAWKSCAAELLKAHPDAASRLIIEITESVAIGDIDATQALIATLQGFGVRVAMDDFGAGHSSFRNLRRLGFDLLKLDGAFVQNLLRSPDDAHFVRTLLDLAKHLGIPTVAEYVEDEDTAALLAEWGADYFQGYLFGRAE